MVLIWGVLGQYWFYRDICLVLVTQAGALCTGVFSGNIFTQYILGYVRGTAIIGAKADRVNRQPAIDIAVLQW